MDISYRSYPVNAVLFDLDGTLVHTAPDITEGVNRMLEGCGLPALSEAAVTRLIGKGSPVLIDRVLNVLEVQWSAGDRLQALQSFQQHYEEVVGRHAKLYPGVLEALEELRTMGGVKLAIVTNKYHRFALRLLQQFKLSPMIDLVVGGDTLEVRKPNPLPLLHACDGLGVAVSETIYIGDSINDVEAATGAGMPVYCVPYGYNEGHPAASLPCNGLIDSIREVPDLVRGRPSTAARCAPRRALG